MRPASIASIHRPGVSRESRNLYAASASSFAALVFYRLEVQCERAVHEVRPLHEGHLDDKHGHGHGQVDDVHVVGGQGQPEHAGCMHQDAGQPGEEEENQEHPVRIVRILVDFLFFLETAQHGVTGKIEDGEGGVVADDADHVEVRVVHLEIFQEYHDQQEHRAIAGDQDEVLQPADFGFLLRTLAPLFLGGGVENKGVQFRDENRQRNLLPVQNEIHHPQGIGQQEEGQDRGHGHIAVVDLMHRNKGFERDAVRGHALGRKRAGKREETHDHQRHGQHGPDFPVDRFVEPPRDAGPVVARGGIAPQRHHQLAGIGAAGTIGRAFPAIVAGPDVGIADEAVLEAPQRPDDFLAREGILLGRKGARGRTGRALIALLERGRAKLLEFFLEFEVRLDPERRFSACRRRVFAVVIRHCRFPPLSLPHWHKARSGLHALERIHADVVNHFGEIVEDLGEAARIRKSATGAARRARLRAPSAAASRGRCRRAFRRVRCP